MTSVLQKSLAVLVTATLTGCAGAQGAAGGGAGPSAGAGARSGPAAGSGGVAQPPAGEAPGPDVRIPKDPAELAEAVKRTTAALNAGIEDWDKTREPPRDVALYGLHQQRVYRALARDASLTKAVLARLPKPLAAEARDHVHAIARLLAMAHPITAAQRKKLRFADPLPAELLRGHMVAAERRFGVEWEVLAAIMLVETRFGRIRSSSSTGAQGPMQFMPGTWRQYGMGGDVHDAKDAIMAAANYLKASGAPRDYRRAVFAYNRDVRYVDAVLTHAKQIKRDKRSYYAYYNWQIFVLSAKGDVRMTGPR
ncbi:lytic transglycosylase domain-containing protein [Nonomuraea longicatena]